ncbi:MAG: hypothetical protein H0X51_06370 [Parachlamydiaceae bacterium]|nr:hypothetical protein [Parachlamydiaceae bacterium]
MSSRISALALGTKRALDALGPDIEHQGASKRAKGENGVVASVATEVLQQESKHETEFLGLTTAQRNWFACSELTLIPQSVRRVDEGESKAAAEEPKNQRRRFYHKKAKNAPETPLKVAYFDGLVSALRARSALTQPQPITPFEAAAQMGAMASENTNFTTLFRKAVAMPAEAENKGEAAEEALSKLKQRCCALTDLAPYLVEKLNQQKLLPPKLIQEAVQHCLTLDEAQGNDDNQAFNSLSIQQNIFYCGFKESEPVLLFSIKKLGEGTYGDVFTVVEISPSAEIDQTKALKLSKTTANGYNTAPHLINETEWLQRTQGFPGLVQMDYPLDIRKPSCMKRLDQSTPPISHLVKGIVFPLGECLYDIITKGNKTQIERLQLAEKLAQTVIKILDETDVVHRDIKPENMLYMNDEILFSDLMDVAFTKEEDNFDLFSGSPHYVCPEMDQRIKQMIKEKNSKIRAENLLKQMSFSCAMVLYEILTSRSSRPLNIKRQPELEFDINTDNLKNYPPIITELMKALLHKNPDKRFYNWPDVLRHLQNVIAEWGKSAVAAASPASSSEASSGAAARAFSAAAQAEKENIAPKGN